VYGVLTLVGTGSDASPGEGKRLLLRAFSGCAGGALANASRLAEARAAVAAAEEAARSRARTLAAISHEIRTPLHSILGYAQLLIDDIPQPIPEASRRYVGSIAQGAKHLARLVEDVLSLHRLDDAHHPLDLSEVAADQVLENCAAILGGAARDAGLDLATSAPSGITLRTDATKLRQVLLNLIGNAIKFTRAGGVTITACADDDHVVFSVRDTGPGIDAAEIPHIFEPFWRGWEASERKVDGAGLGLALVHALVRRLGGELELDTVRGEGSTFRVRLPHAIEG
jgi:signal transduction histidine kinase